MKINIKQTSRIFGDLRGLDFDIIQIMTVLCGNRIVIPNLKASACAYDESIDDRDDRLLVAAVLYCAYDAAEIDIVCVLHYACNVVAL